MKTTMRKLINLLGYDVTVQPIANKLTSANTKVVYIHIPKCGGVSIDTALRNLLGQVGQGKIKRKPMIASSLFEYDKPLNSLEQQADFSEFHAQKIREILAYHLNLNWQYVSGHVNVSKKLLDTYSGEYDFITLLRDPVDRFISNYVFNKLTNELEIMAPFKDQHSLTQDELIAEVDTILASKRGWHMANTPTMFITGRYPRDNADAQEMGEEFINNLKKFKVVGFLDDLADFEQKCIKVINKPLEIKSLNRTADLNTDYEQFVQQTLKDYFAQPETLNRVKALCEFENRNYLRAKEILG